MKDPAEAVKLLLKAFYPYIMRVICNNFFFFLSQDQTTNSVLKCPTFGPSRIKLDLHLPCLHGFSQSGVGAGVFSPLCDSYPVSAL